MINFYFIFLVKKSNKKRKATSTPHLSVKNDSDRKRHRRINKNKSNGNTIFFFKLYKLYCKPLENIFACAYILLSSTVSSPNFPTV